MIIPKTGWQKAGQSQDPEEMLLNDPRTCRDNRRMKSTELLEEILVNL
jgi:hypothetical protein